MNEQKDYLLEAQNVENEIAKAREEGDLTRAGYLENERNYNLEKAHMMDSELDSLYKNIGLKQNQLGKITEEINKESRVYDELIKQEMKIAGINGKTSESVKLIDAKIKKLTEERSILEKNYRNGQVTTEEYQKQNQKLSDQIGKLNESKGRIVDIQGEQNEVTGEINKQIESGGKLNTILDRDHVKDVKIDDNGGANKLQKEAEKPATKKTKVTDNGDANKIHKDAEKQANKKVKLSLANTLKSLLPASLSIPVNLIGKLTGKFATGTRNAPGGLSLVGEEGPELVHLPRGAKVVPNGDTMSLLQKWNIPTASAPKAKAASGGASGAVAMPTGNTTVVFNIDGKRSLMRLFLQLNS